MNLKDFQYELPEHLIAKHPLKDRDSSKLLFYNQGKISHHIFKEITQLLSNRALLCFNNTKVIPARLFFYKETGARIEILLLDPVSPSMLFEEVMNTSGKCTWKCMVGNSRKWGIGSELQVAIEGKIMVKAFRIDLETVTFRWETTHSFSEILDLMGQTPLPPYLHREAVDEDKPRYQTVYSRHEGAVAAPTAGLHFTEALMKDLQRAGIKSDFVTLHVSAGTFQPIKEDIASHPMHREQILVTRENLINWLAHETIFPVGTTSLRTLESVFWYGVKLEGGEKEFLIEKTFPYRYDNPRVTKEKSLQNVLEYMESNKLERLVGHTEIFILPGYEFKLCKGLITNFHLPSSTLILLIAAMIGEDWKKVYEQAILHNYRFLSYGDSSFLLPKIN